MNVDRCNSFINQSNGFVCIRVLLKCLTQVTYFAAKMDNTQTVKLMTTCQGSLVTECKTLLSVYRMQFMKLTG